MKESKFSFAAHVFADDASSVEREGVSITARIVYDPDYCIDDDDMHHKDPNSDTFKGSPAGEYERTQAARKAWEKDEWFYCGIVVDLERDGWSKSHVASLWGLEANYPGSDNSYLAEVAEELAEEALATD